MIGLAARSKVEIAQTISAHNAIAHYITTNRPTPTRSTLAALWAGCMREGRSMFDGLNVDPGAPLSLRLGANCSECGEGFSSSRRSQQFCSAICRKAFHNRRMRRGVDCYDLIMSLRFDRQSAKDEGAWTLLSRMAAEFRRLDVRDREGRRSWEPVAAVKARRPRLAARILGHSHRGRR